jgi:hypothetical protein
MIKTASSVLAASVFATLLVACGTPQSVVQPLAANSIRVVFKNAGTDEVLARIGKKCSQIGGVVKEATSEYLLCTRRLSDTDAELVNAPIDTSRGAKPENRMKFMVNKVDANVIVTTLQWAEIKTQSGQWTQIAMSHAKQKANMKKILLSMGAVS